MRLRRATLACACAIGVLAASTAGAGQKGHLTIDAIKKKQELTGKLSRVPNDCTFSREIKGYWNGGHGKHFSDGGLFGITDDGGKYSLSGAMGGIPDGKWYAKAVRQGSDCPAVKSKIINVKGLSG